MVPEPLRSALPGGEPFEIPGYKLEGVIGRGATGTVFRARQLAVDREVALKVLHPELAQRRRIIQRLQREARTTARLAHPHIVSAIDMGETGGRWWYAMELVDGPSLAEVLRQQGRLREREALRLFIPLCEALEHLAEHGVVHRDIKPANILIDKAGGARLADLGLAFADDDPALTSQGGTLGTPHYISPEQAMDSARADLRSDIWSFGATLYHAVCGRPPFHGDSAAEVLSGVLHARVPDPLRFEPELSRGLALILRKCLTREPLERYQTPHELLLDLERVRERRAPRVVARSLDPVERAPRPWVRPALLAGSALLGLVLVFVAAGRLRERGQGRPEAPEADPARFAPLEVLAARAEVAPEGSGAILRELEDLRPRLPAAHLPAWESVRERVRARLRVDLAAAADRADAASERLAKAGDFAGARAALAVELPRELVATTGFSLDELEERFGFLRARRQALLARLEESESELSKVLARKVPDVTAGLLQEAGRLEARGRYKSALDLLAVDDDALLAAAGYAGYRFSSDRIAGLFSDARMRLGLKRMEVDFAWRSVDSELRDFVDRRAARLREALAVPGETSPSAAVDLGRSFETELFERGLERAEMPAESSRFALDRLENAQRELLLLEDYRRGESLKSAYHLNRDLDGSRWSRRDYGAVLSLWTDFEETLRSAPGDPAAPWRVELARGTALRLEEARLLEDLLRRAADGVRAADGEQRELMVGASGIVEEGKIAAGLDPLRDGFELLPEHGAPFHLRLETIAGRDLLLLAGLPQIDEDLEALDRLVVAAFRFHERELARAEATLRSGELPEEQLLSELAADLGPRILAELEREESARDVRDSEVSYLLGLATEEAIQDAPDRALMAIDKLLFQYPDVADVKVLRPRLQEEQRRLENRRHSFEDSYRPAALVEQRDGSVALSFRFDGESAGTWEPGAWRFDGKGWSRPEAAGDWQELARRHGARLILRPPLDAGRDVELSLRFEVVDTHAPAQLLLVSVLGYHVALTGTGLASPDPRSRCLVGEGDLYAFLDQVRREKGEEGLRLLRPGTEQELKLLVNPRRGLVRLELDGVSRGQRSFPGRAPEPASIELRSFDPIRVLSAEVRGSR
jgi:tRNA A-37 threonylcarbamoyl transferase component Bud32